MRVIGTVLLFAAFGTWAWPQDKTRMAEPSGPLFTAFQTYCVQPAANPKTVEAVLLKVGAIPVYSGQSKGPSEHASTKTWTVTLGGRTIRVSSVTYNMFSWQADWACIVSTRGYDLSSVDAVRHWVGVAPFRSDDHSWSFSYDEIGANRVRVPYGRPDAAQGERVNWMLEVQDHNGTEFELTRHHQLTGQHK